MIENLTDRPTGGELRYRVILQSPGGSRDAVGGRLTTWTNVATVYANIRPLNSLEQMRAAQRQASTSHTVTIRYSSLFAMDASWRVLWGARILVLDGSPVNMGEKNEWLELSCVEGLRSE